jgi:hypothetical protein
VLIGLLEAELRRDTEASAQAHAARSGASSSAKPNR